MFADRGDAARAEQHFQRAVSIFAPRPPDDPIKNDTLAIYREFLLGQGRTEEANALQ